MLSAREQAEATISAFVAGWLDGAEEQWPEGFEIGAIGIAFETQFPPEEPGGYGHNDVGYTCSDPREWVQAALFRRAMLTAEASMNADGSGSD